MDFIRNIKAARADGTKPSFRPASAELPVA
jgi:hypothetical protein